jgi:hypothetical protein
LCAPTASSTACSLGRVLLTVMSPRLISPQLMAEIVVTTEAFDGRVWSGIEILKSSSMRLMLSKSSSQK